MPLNVNVRRNTTRAVRVRGVDLLDIDASMSCDAVQSC